MKAHFVLAVVVLGLAAVTMTQARPQDAGKQEQQNDQALSKPTGGGDEALQARIAKLRAEVELMEIEHEVEKVFLTDMLKNQGYSDVQRAAEAEKQVNQMSLIAASLGKLAEYEKELGGDEATRVEVEKEMKSKADKLRAEAESKKKSFVKNTTEMHLKKLELAVLERQFANVK